MLLNRITERYQLDLVMVFEDNTENDGMVMTNYFGNNFSFYGKSAFPKKSPSLKELQPGEYMIVKIRGAILQRGWEIILSQRIHTTKKLRFLLWLENLNMLGAVQGK